MSMNHIRFYPLAACLGALACVAPAAQPVANPRGPVQPGLITEAPVLSWVEPGERVEDVARTRGLVVKVFDINRDGRPDIYKFFKSIDDPQNPGNKLDLLVRKELDINHDGKFDVVRSYDDKGQVVTEEVDLDFDGKVDEITYFEDGLMARKELDFNYDGKPDVVKYYTNGHLVRIESDRGHHGKVDTWEYYADDALDRIGTDTDGDGQVDHWERKGKEVKESKATADAP